MKQILSAFGYGLIQDCFGLLKTLGKQGLSHEEFLAFVEESKNEANDFIKEEMKKELPKKEKPKKNIFLKQGETELMKGVVCEKCKGVVYIEGICSSNPLVRQGFVRRGICGACGNEFGIR
jgi:hypothetical protein